MRKIRLHDLRHTFGSLLIQAGASLAYVKDQMGHSSIQVTVDTYGHLITGANVSLVDFLETSGHKNAPRRPHIVSLSRPIPGKLLIWLVAAAGLEPATYGL